MISFGNKRWLVSLGATVAWRLVGATLSSACKPRAARPPHPHRDLRRQTRRTRAGRELAKNTSTGSR
jgi:hypothetical protein